MKSTCSPQCSVTYEINQFNIRYQNEGDSIDAYVTDLSKADTPRSYNISTDRGQRLRRNRRLLMKATENRVPEPDVFYDCQEEIQNDNSVSTNNISNQDTTKRYTSSGREVKIPKKYEDFVMKGFEIWIMQGHNNPQRSVVVKIRNLYK